MLFVSPQVMTAETLQQTQLVTVCLTAIVSRIASSRSAFYIGRYEKAH
jgi:hypothetical protein